MKYPYDIFKAANQKATFTVEGHFVSAMEESPMKVFNPSFSRYICTIISDGSVAYFNIHISDLPGMRARTDVAVQMDVKPAAVMTEGAAGTSPAFTRRFFSGNLKGKTPIEVLLSDPGSGKKALNDQYVWLKSNLEKYPKNKELMEAIEDAASQDLSTLQASPPQDGSKAPVTILDIGCRPLQRKVREDGKCFCYEGKVTYNPAMNYPVTVEIKNYYAPVTKRENGTLNVQIGSKDAASEKAYRYNMSLNEWLDALHTMETTRDEFRMLCFGKAYQLAEAAANAARTSAA